jgi:hypothetical protein
VFTKPRAYTPFHRTRTTAPANKGIKTMTIKSNAFANVATLVLAVLPLVVIAGSLVTSF